MFSCLCVVSLGLDSSTGAIDYLVIFIVTMSIGRCIYIDVNCIVILCPDEDMSIVLVETLTIKSYSPVELPSTYIYHA